jgi:hypothetical protein
MMNDFYCQLDGTKIPIISRQDEDQQQKHQQMNRNFENPFVDFNNLHN